MKLKNIAVFCGSSTGFNLVYKEGAIALGDYFVKNKIGLIYGGAKIGLMGAVADAIIQKEGSVIGIIPELLQHEEVIHSEVSELIITKKMSERKVLMSKRTDAYISLPGGFGTLDELFEVLTLQQLSIEQKPVGLLNINGFFDATIKQLDKMTEEGFLKLKNKKMLLIDTTVTGLMKQMEAYAAPEKTSVINKVIS